jgi:uncharacterized membrane protein YoaT (DUF817 family)
MRALHFTRYQANDTRLEKYSKELLSFGIKQVFACVFPAFIFCMLIISNLIHIPFLPRYDFLLIACIVMQAIMFFSKVETGAEVLVITLFHLLGLFMEVFKVAMHSWSYPEFAYSKIFDVPLYSGFMYASVGSYVCQAWRWNKLRIENWPGFLPAAFISLSIYLNFFTHHYIYDFRWVLTLLLLIIFWKTKVIFNTNNVDRKMPLVLSFLLIGFFIWIGENIATYFGAWKYATQHEGWKMVSLGKISSWFLLVVLSIVIVIQLKFSKAQNETRKSS